MADINLNLQQRQELKMTVELRQAIEMLQMSALEVQEMVNREISDNPCLEADNEGEPDGVLTASSTPATAQDARQTDREWDSVNWSESSFTDEGNSGPLAPAGAATWQAGDEDNGWENHTSTEDSLQDYVTKQYDEIVTDPKLRMVGRFLIDGLDDAGYLRLNLTEVAEKLRVAPDVVDDARAILQTLEPTGVGAQSLAECLRLQLHAKRLLTPATEACLAHLEKMAAGQLAWLAKQAGVKESDIVDAMADIKDCNPKPALGFGSRRIDAVVPDVIVRRDVTGAWEAALNANAFPTLRAVNPKRFESWAAPDKQASAYLAERFGKAKWLVGALEQRAQNTLKIARAVVTAQKPFLDAGLEFLVPLTMRQVGQLVGVHESTVSRIARGKYLQTPFGVFEMARFFSAGVASTGGPTGVASGSVQTIISRLVRAENPAKPLSDEQLVTLLKQEGVEVARRTIAKYRGVLGIPGTAERRVR